MLTIQETIWQLVRNRSRTIILLLASVMLAGCMAFYLGNIRANEEAVARLADTVTVTAEVGNSRGDRIEAINIAPLRRDNFIANPYLQHFVMYSSALGAFSEEARAQDPFVGGDCNVVGVNCLEAVWMPERDYTFLDGYDESFLEGDEPLCLVHRELVEKGGVEMGGEVTLPVYTCYHDSLGNMVYTPLGDQTLKVVGTTYSLVNPKGFMVPAGWLRKTAESQGVEFFYNYLSGDLKDPRQLNQFKDSIYEMSFLEPNAESRDEFSGSTIVVQDEEYITSVEPLGQNILLFRQFLIPFFVLVIGMIVLAVFLIMRNSQREIAIASSLGRPKALSALASFLAAFVVELAGVLLVIPAAVLLAELSVSSGLLICGTFLLCACVGNALGLLLILRFNTLVLLTAPE